MKKSKSVDSHKIADLFKEVPINRWSHIIGVVPGGSSHGDIVLIVGTIIIIAMLVGSIFVLWK